jgi:hypothetical protein
MRRFMLAWPTCRRFREGERLDDQKDDEIRGRRGNTFLLFKKLDVT